MSNLTSKRNELKALIKKHGNPSKVAKALKIAPATIYYRMSRLNLKCIRRSIKGEPSTNIARKTFWAKLIKQAGTIEKAAKLAQCSSWTVCQRLNKYGLVSKGNRTSEPAYIKTRTQRVSWLTNLLKKHGNPFKVAKAIGVTPSAVYQRIKRYELN